MKKIILSLALLAGLATNVSAQQKDNYRRSSLYSIMVIDTDVKGSSGADGEELQAITNSIPKLFEATPVPDKYDDHNLDLRTMSLKSLPAAEAGVDIQLDNVKGGGVIEKFGLEEKLGLVKDKDIIARLLTMFKKEHTAQKLIYKWYISPDGKSFSPDYLLQDRSLSSRSEEENQKFAELSGSDRARLLENISKDLINKTFIMVNVYTYKSAETIKDLLHVAIVETAAAKNPLAGQAANVAFALATKNLKGYMCCYKTYLFRVNFDEKAFGEKWATGDPEEFLKSDEGYITYVGKTTGMRPVVSATGKKTTDDVLQKVTARTIDESVAKLQKEYEEFKTLTTLHLAEDGKTLIAYIGKKEGLKGGEKFDVLEKSEDEEGNVTYKEIGSVTAVKGKIWDNRAGAGNAEIADEDEDEKDNSSAALTATEFKGNAKKHANYLIRLKK